MSSKPSRFRGPAPLHHVLLAGRTRTGVTLQTLHPDRFDHGIILAQTPRPGFEIPEPETCTVDELRAFVAPIGADMLIDGIRQQVFVPPLTDVGWYQGRDGDKSFIPAPMITPVDRHVAWRLWTADAILRRHRVIGRLWNYATVMPGKEKRRVSWKPGFKVCEWIQRKDLPAPGVPFTDPGSKRDNLLVCASDGKVLQIDEFLVEGSITLPAKVAASRAGLIAAPDGKDFLTFHDQLS